MFGIEANMAPIPGWNVQYKRLRQSMKRATGTATVTIPLWALYFSHTEGNNTGDFTLIPEPNPSDLKDKN